MHEKGGERQAPSFRRAGKGRAHKRREAGSGPFQGGQTGKSLPGKPLSGGLGMEREGGAV